MVAPADKDPKVAHLIEEAEKVNIIQMNEEGLKRLLTTLSQKYKRNMDLRTKYKNNPEKFAESEADLDAELKNVQMVSAYPRLLLSFVTQRGVDILMDVLGHENTDISIDVVGIFKELTEDDVILSVKENLEFIDYLASKGIPLLLIDTIERLSTERDEDLEGIYNILSTLENIADYKPDICEYYFQQEKLMQWLLTYMTSEKEKELNDAKLCACELLSVIVQHSKEAQEKLGKSVDFLEILKEINRRCTGEYETNEDYVENLFDIVCSCLLITESKDKFMEYEGIQLMLKLMSCGLKNRRCALKALDFALTNTPANCKVFVSSSGLSYLFAVLMKKGYQKNGKLRISENELRKDEEHCMSIICSLLKYCKGVNRDRIIYKFKEGGGEKVQRLSEMYETYVEAYEKYLERLADAEEDKERENIYIEELDNGLFTFQLVGIAIGILIVEKEPQILEVINDIIAGKRIRLDVVVEAIKEYIEHMDEKGKEYEILQEVLETLEKDLGKGTDKKEEVNKKDQVESK